MNTAKNTRAAPIALTETQQLGREILERIADRWTLLVIQELGQGDTLRFSQLRDRIGCISQKMLTQTLRQLERDGLVARHVYPVVPPRVEYTLTGLGHSLRTAVSAICGWVDAHQGDVEVARQRYDAQAAPGSM